MSQFRVCHLILTGSSLAWLSTSLEMMIPVSGLIRWQSNAHMLQLLCNSACHVLRNEQRSTPAGMASPSLRPDPVGNAAGGNRRVSASAVYTAATYQPALSCRVSSTDSSRRAPPSHYILLNRLQCEHHVHTSISHVMSLLLWRRVQARLIVCLQVIKGGGSPQSCMLIC